MKEKSMRNFTVFCVFFFLSDSSAFFTTVGKFVNFEFYYEIASYSFTDSILFGEREKRTTNTLTKQSVHLSLEPFTWRRYFNIFEFFIVFWIKFRKTNKIVVTFVATTLKALLSVAKTSRRLSGHKFYAGNVYYLFLIILAHISPYQHTKRCATEAAHRKTQTPSCRQTNLYADRYFHTINGSRIFTKWISFMMREKGYSYPIKKNTPISAIIKFVWHNHYITFFAVCKQV